MNLIRWNNGLFINDLITYFRSITKGMTFRISTKEYKPLDVNSINSSKQDKFKNRVVTVFGLKKLDDKTR